MKKVILQTLGVTLLLAVLSVSNFTPANAKKMTCPEHTPVLIDIKPGSYPNTINISSSGLLPVAVLSTPSFDASLFLPEMVHLSDANTAMSGGCHGAMAVRWAWDDVNRDGELDILFFFVTRELDFTISTSAATLMAHGGYGGDTLHIMGTDSVRVKP